MEIILLMIGVYFIIMSFVVNTKNLAYTLLFKILPFFSGSYLVFYFLYISGYVVVGSTL